MMNSKKKKGFSLAELLISLLIISIVLAAAIPTITKKNKAGEKTWHYAEHTGNMNSIYSATGSQQRVILGADRVPFSEESDSTAYLNKFFNDDTVFDESEFEHFKQNFTVDGDKLVILKATPYKLSNFTNSHLSFFTLDQDVPVNDANKIHYAGRLSSDRHNLALGIASLQSFNTETTPGGFNTALGHHTLTYNTVGRQNTAVGEKTLTRNKVGYDNTALGYQALTALNTEALDNAKKEGDIDVADNTAVGAHALSTNVKGGSNTAIGANALSSRNNPAGLIKDLESYNTALGANACTWTRGSYNLCLGYGSRPIHSSLADKHFGLSIGSVRDTDEKDPSNPSPHGIPSTNPSLGPEKYYGSIYNKEIDVPIITGVMQAYNSKGDGGPPANDVDKQLHVNSRIFAINTFNGYKPMFLVRSTMGAHPAMKKNAKGEATGVYTENIKKAYVPDASIIGDFFFNLRETDDHHYKINSQTNKKTGTSILLSMSGIFDEVEDKQLVLFAEDKHANNNTTDLRHRYADFLLNNRLRLDFYDDPTSGSIVNIGTKHKRIFENAWSGANTAYGAVSFDKFVHVVTSSIGNASNEYNDLQYFAIEGPRNKYNGDADRKAISYNKDRGVDALKIKTKDATVETDRDIYLKAGKKIQFEVVEKGRDSNPANPTKGILFKSDDIQFHGKSADAKITFTSPIEVLVGDQNTSAAQGLKIDPGKANIFLWAPGGLKTDIWDLYDRIGDLEAKPSDIRLKDVSGDNTAGLKEINALEVKNFTYKKDKDKKPQVGVIAQQLQKVFPNSVIKDSDGYLRIKTDEIFYAMVNSIKELFAMVQDLTAKVVGLDKRITELEQQNKLLKEQNAAFEKRLEKLEKQIAK